MTKPLAGLKVLEFAWSVAGPVVGRALADYGATVVRVESGKRPDVTRLMGPFPDGMIDKDRSALFEDYNLGKLCIALDMGNPAAREVIKDLVAWADVVSESFSPGQMERWGLGYEALKAINPGIILLSNSLLGQHGPLSKIAGYGNLGAALASVHSTVGQAGSPPVGPFGSYTDYTAPRFGLFSVLAALDHRDRTGEGAWIDLGQSETAFQFFAPLFAEQAATGRTTTPQGNRSPEMAPHGVFRAAGQDSWVAIAARDDADWTRLAAEIGGPLTDPRLSHLAGRKAAEDEIEAAIGAWTQAQPAEQVEARLQQRRVPAHVVAGSAEMASDPQLAHLGYFIEVERLSGGKTTVEASRFMLSETPFDPAEVAPPPLIGSDSRTIMCDFLGYDDRRIDDLVAQAAIC